MSLTRGGDTVTWYPYQWANPQARPLARAANTKCYSCKGEHEFSMMIVEHHGQPGKSHEHLQRTRTQRIPTP
eukprot:2419201-Rhodomonas_salina.4